ncbi:hypothetical protein K402DRAFT_306680, partial [Aulographum hederae CBS 113979]
MLVHYCSSCGYNTPVPFSDPSVFSDTHTCTHCGSTSLGVQGNGKTESDMQEEDLAGLFARNLALSAPAPIPTPPPEDPPKTEEPQEPSQPAPAPITYITQHYHHSRYVAPSAPKPDPAQVQHPPTSPIEENHLAQILLRNSIDPQSLFPSQINLFQNADDDQRLRLLELWRISPPSTMGGPDLARQMGMWPKTSLQKEEALARLRYEHKMNDVDQEYHPSSAPATLPSSPTHGHAEPYILSGYEQLSRREYDPQQHLSGSGLLQETTKYNQSTDPAYRSWQKTGSPGFMDMENQYGAFEQMRGAGV